jgi:hypothetical protein
MRTRLILITASLCFLAAGTARATSGGEWLCDVLGYDEADGRVYIHQLDGGGGDSFGFVAWLATRGPDAGILHGVDWDRWGEGTGEDPELRKRLAELRAGLTPLPALTWPTLPFSVTTVARDTVPNDMGQDLRLRVQANFGGPLLELTCWVNDRVARPVVYELPGGAGWIWVVAFTGDPYEMGYETQMPVLVQPGERGETIRQVAWRRLKD